MVVMSRQRHSRLSSSSFFFSSLMMQSCIMFSVNIFNLNNSPMKRMLPKYRRLALRSCKRIGKLYDSTRLDRQTVRQPVRLRQTERDRQRQTDRQTQIGKQTDRQTQTDRHTQTDRQTDKQTQTNRQKTRPTDRYFDTIIYIETKPSIKGSIP